MPVQRLSGGFKRRLAIAMSLMNQPELLILDEPTTGLDPAVRLALWARVRELRAAGTTVLLTTHYMDEAERLCDRVAIMAEREGHRRRARRGADHRAPRARDGRARLRRRRGSGAARRHAAAARIACAPGGG